MHERLACSPPRGLGVYECLKFRASNHQDGSRPLLDACSPLFPDATHPGILTSSAKGLINRDEHAASVMHPETVLPKGLDKFIVQLVASLQKCFQASCAEGCC